MGKIAARGERWAKAGRPARLPVPKMATGNAASAATRRKRMLEADTRISKVD